MRPAHSRAGSTSRGLQLDTPGATHTCPGFLCVAPIQPLHHPLSSRHCATAAAHNTSLHYYTNYYTLSAVKLLACQGEPSSIPGGVVPRFSLVDIVPDDAAGWRVFSGISGFSALAFRRRSMLTSQDPDVEGGMDPRVQGQEARERYGRHLHAPLNSLARETASVCLRDMQYRYSACGVCNQLHYSGRRVACDEFSTANGCVAGQDLVHNQEYQMEKCSGRYARRGKRGAGGHCRSVCHSGRRKDCLLASAMRVVTSQRVAGDPVA
ncbi:hypothetical protein PR048_007470 [Dryococelus australis]|uniref:Uncharacterized protein n=1 Tax=Dryococelus australis TaxID=614101 RepID=A0ABQ9HUB2_9NEOP|nr:hypothetical protein PR048_007470 [Dryococelus australis]